jgi:hypothetical protein
MRVTDVARQLGVNKTTLWRWGTDPVFQAEIDRLRALAAARAMQGVAATPARAPCTPTRPNAPSRTLPHPSDGPECKTKPNRFLATVIQLGKEGLSTYSNPDEFRRRLREAGFEA